MNNTILEKKKRVSDQVLYALIQLSSFLSIFILLVIIGYILYRGIPAFDFSYLVNTTSIINDTVGILPNIINTLYIVIVTLLIACPIGIGGAIYLNEYTKNKKFVSIISFTTNIFKHLLSSGGTLTIQLYLEMAKGNYEVSFVIALVLVVIVLGLNMLAKWISRRFDVNKGDN